MTTHDHGSCIAAFRPVSSAVDVEEGRLEPSDRLPPPADRVTAWLRRRLGRAVVLSYVAALLLPGPGLWLRRDHTVPIGTVTGLPLSTAPLLLSLVLFSAGLQVPVRELGRLLRKPTALVAGLVLHLVIPLLVIPVVAFGLHRTPDSDGGRGLITAMILIVAMPVAAGATVWTGKGDGDQPAMVGLVLASTLLSPLTIPLVITTLMPLLDGGYADTLATTGRTAAWRLRPRHRGPPLCSRRSCSDSYCRRLGSAGPCA